MRKLTFWAGLGAGLMYFLDPTGGNRRRALAKDRIAGYARRLVRRGEHTGRGVASQAYGLKQKATHLREEPKEFDDVTLARKVESEIFRDADAPKGQVSVNVANGVVPLRGAVERPDLVEELEAATRKVQGVKDVENLLHPAGTDAPNAPGF
jgi:osmotically-inducible protein OsmY